VFDPKSRITKVEATVALKLNQGTIPQSGCNRLWGSFFGSFLEKQKSDKIIRKNLFYFSFVLIKKVRDSLLMIKK